MLRARRFSCKCPSQRDRSPDQEYVIGPNDVVEVYVLKMPELSREYVSVRKAPSKCRSSVRFQAERKTSRELSAAIAKGLQSGYLSIPGLCDCQTGEPRYFIQGAVRSPVFTTLKAGQRCGVDQHLRRTQPGLRLDFLYHA